MTDYRRTEEELWEEDDVAEDDRRTNVLPMFAPGTPASAQRPAAEPTGQAAAHPAPDAAGPGPAAGGNGSNGTFERSVDPVGSVARFISEPARSEAPPASVDTPGWSLQALAMIANDVVAEPDAAKPTNGRALPPALPAAALPAPSTELLPSMMLGPAMSTRGDATERVTTIPKTHPLANSIAPGGSRVTVPPGRQRAPQRWHIALGLLALLGAAGGAALFLQSRGEHHAVSGTRSDVERSATSEAARDQHVLVEPMEETTIVIEEPPAPLLVDSEAAEPREEQGRSPALSPSEPPPRTARARPLAAVDRSALAEADAKQPPSALRVSVGSVQLRERATQTAVSEPRPERAQVIQAMNAIAAELRACVGEAHGVADVTLTVRGTGAVSHALVEGAFAGTDKGSCIARILRTARLPPFTEPVLHIAYPLQL